MHFCAHTYSSGGEQLRTSSNDQIGTWPPGLKGEAQYDVLPLRQGIVFAEDKADTAPPAT